MNVFRSIVFSSVVAGFVVGAIITVIQQFGTVPLILKAEVYEKAAEAHHHDDMATNPAEGAAAVHEGAGHLSWHEGLMWGLAGFAVFTLAPGLGLPPELPGVPAAPLLSRQLWWV